MEIGKSTDSINYLYHSRSMVETKTRQLCEERENFTSTEENIQMKRIEYENFMKNSMLINKVNEYQKAKHNHSLNYLKLRRSKSYSDFFETRENIKKYCLLTLINIIFFTFLYIIYIYIYVKH